MLAMLAKVKTLAVLGLAAGGIAFAAQPANADTRIGINLGLPFIGRPAVVVAAPVYAAPVVVQAAPPVCYTPAPVCVAPVYAPAPVVVYRDRPFFYGDGFRHDDRRFDRDHFDHR